MTQPYEARLFIAVPLPNRFRPILSTWVEELKLGWDFKSWVHPADYHITLKYLGTCDFPTANSVKRELRKIVNEQAPFQLELSGLGIFGQVDKPRILWTGVKGELHTLAHLQELIEDQMVTLGFQKEERPYRPHLTLARKYKGENFPYNRLDQVINLKDGIVTWPVHELILYQSHLKGEPPFYQPIAVFPLKEEKSGQ